MTTFKDGPAHGVTLMLKRAPYYLRVVIDENGKIDALDQPDDEPTLTETIYAYRIIGKPGSIHINKRGKPGGGFFVMAEYEYVFPQPPQEAMRHRFQWGEWCQQNAPEQMP